MKLLKLYVENDDEGPPEKGNVNDKDDHGNEEEITDEVPNEDNETDVGLEAGLLEPLEPGIGDGKESGDIGDVSLECVFMQFHASSRKFYAIFTQFGLFQPFLGQFQHVGYQKAST